MTWFTSKQSQLTPKQKYRFVVLVGSELYLPNVKTVTKPAVEVSSQEYRLINHHFNYPGLVKWSPIKITFVDLAGRLIKKGGPRATSELLYNMLRKTGYNHPIESGLTTPEKTSTVANAFGRVVHKKISDKNPGSATVSISDKNKPTDMTMQIIQFSPGKTESIEEDGKVKYKAPEAVEIWTLVNPIIKGINWGDLSYSDDDMVEYTLDVAYDWAEHSTEMKEGTFTINWKNFFYPENEE